MQMFNPDQGRSEKVLTLRSKLGRSEAGKLALKHADFTTTEGRVSWNSSGAQYARAFRDFCKHLVDAGVIPKPESVEECEEMIRYGVGMRIEQSYIAGVGNWVSGVKYCLWRLKWPYPTSEFISDMYKYAQRFSEFVAKNVLYPSDLVIFHNSREVDWTNELKTEFKRLKSRLYSPALWQQTMYENDTHGQFVNSSTKKLVTLLISLMFLTFHRIGDFLELDWKLLTVEANTVNGVDTNTVYLQTDRRKTFKHGRVYVKNGKHIMIKDMLLNYKRCLDLDEFHIRFLRKLAGDDRTKYHMFWKRWHSGRRTLQKPVPIDRTLVAELVQFVAKVSGRKGHFTPHSTRHGAASAAQESGELSETQINILGGWKGQLTQKRYTEVGKTINVAKTLGM